MICQVIPQIPKTPDRYDRIRHLLEHLSLLRINLLEKWCFTIITTLVGVDFHPKQRNQTTGDSSLLVEPIIA